MPVGVEDRVVVVDVGGGDEVVEGALEGWAGGGGIGGGHGDEWDVDVGVCDNKGGSCRYARSTVMFLRWEYYIKW